MRGGLGAGSGRALVADRRIPDAATLRASLAGRRRRGAAAGRTRRRARHRGGRARRRADGRGAGRAAGGGVRAAWRWAHTFFDSRPPRWPPQRRRRRRDFGGRMADCLFCKIVAGEIPAKIVKRSADAVAFRDIDAKAPVHVLVIPTRHFAAVRDAGRRRRSAARPAAALPPRWRASWGSSRRLPHRDQYRPRCRPERGSPASACAGRAEADLAAGLKPRLITCVGAGSAKFNPLFTVYAP